MALFFYNKPFVSSPQLGRIMGTCSRKLLHLQVNMQTPCIHLYADSVWHCHIATVKRNDQFSRHFDFFFEFFGADLFVDALPSFYMMY